MFSVEASVSVRCSTGKSQQQLRKDSGFGVGELVCCEEPQQKAEGVLSETGSPEAAWHHIGQPKMTVTKK